MHYYILRIYNAETHELIGLWSEMCENSHDAVQLFWEKQQAKLNPDDIHIQVHGLKQSGWLV